MGYWHKRISLDLAQDLETTMAYVTVKKGQKYFSFFTTCRQEDSCINTSTTYSQVRSKQSLLICTCYCSSRILNGYSNRNRQVSERPSVYPLNQSIPYIWKTLTMSHTKMTNPLLQHFYHDTEYAAVLASLFILSGGHFCPICHRNCHL